MFDVSYCGKFAVFYSPITNIEFNNVTVSLNTNVEHPNTEIYGFVGEMSDYSITMTNCKFEGNI